MRPGTEVWGEGPQVQSSRRFHTDMGSGVGSRSRRLTRKTREDGGSRWRRKTRRSWVSFQSRRRGDGGKLETENLRIGVCYSETTSLKSDDNRSPSLQNPALLEIWGETYTERSPSLLQVISVLGNSPTPPTFKRLTDDLVEPFKCLLDKVR